MPVYEVWITGTFAKFVNAESEEAANAIIDKENFDNNPNGWEFEEENRGVNNYAS